ncbi:MAG: malQ [Chlamydiales bacterium]|jgi:4-alpha-glucanotransferase|nr:malQ [Chlamydiales bacterium]
MVSSFDHTPAAQQWREIGEYHHHGIAIPLFSLHSEQSCGIGEYLDLLPLIDWTHKVGMDIIQLLPLNDTGDDSSPYNALSAFALNPIHISLSALPNISKIPELEQQLKALRELNKSQRIEYPAVQKGKLSFLQTYFKASKVAIRQMKEFQDFVKDRPWILSYALFKVLKAKNGRSHWEYWPEEEKNPTSKNFKQMLDTYRDEVDFHCWTQYLCDQQLCQVKEYAQQNKVFIKGDIPILISRDSADVWYYRENFNLDYAAGAPPDMYSQEGQYWGFPLYNWEKLAKDNYWWWRERLKTASSYYHLYRIDHVVGFFRIWAIPLGKKATEGFFIPQDEGTWVESGRKIMEMMLETTPHMLPIGEDLGTIPPETRRCLKELGICGTKVMRWERYWDHGGHFIPSHEYIRESMTTVSTHDSETLTLWWRDQKGEAEYFCKVKGWDYHPTLSRDKLQAILRESHHTNSVFHINLLPEYLALFSELVWDKPEDERINVPGIVVDTNWSYRCKPSVDEILSHTQLKTVVRSIIK